MVLPVRPVSVGVAVSASGKPVTGTALPSPLVVKCHLASVPSAATSSTFTVMSAPFCVITTSRFLGSVADEVDLAALNVHLPTIGFWACAWVVEAVPTVSAKAPAMARRENPARANMHTLLDWG